MDKTILNLLFNYKGRITSREFRAGISIVFMLMGTYMAAFLNHSLNSYFAGRLGGGEWLASNTILNQITSIFTPNLVPVWFIISYSSFVLAVKRNRTLNGNRAMGVVSGVINYLFFASFIAMMLAGAFSADMPRFAHIHASLIYILCIFLVLGIANLVYLCIRRESEMRHSVSPNGRLDALSYAIKLGNLIAIGYVGGMIIGFIWARAHFFFFYSTSLRITVGALIIILFFFYVKYSLYRLRDANVSVLWLTGILTAYLVLFGVKIVIYMNSQTYLTVYYDMVFSIAMSFFTLAQYVIFLLPTKNGEQSFTTESIR